MGQTGAKTQSSMISMPGYWLGKTIGAREVKQIALTITIHHWLLLSASAFSIFN
jgi:K+-transporting ATPase A subunit